MRAIERVSEFAGTRDRNKLVRLMIQQRRDVHYATVDLSESLKRLTELFLPRRFRNYVEVDDPYRYSDCQRGEDLVQGSVFSSPKFMTVIARTNLTLEEPAKRGTLRYHKKQVQDEIEKIFPK